MSRNATRSLKNLVTSWAARAVRRPALTAGQLRDLRPDRILIVRQHNQMGDMVCATPAFRALRETFPAAEMALVTAPVNVEVVRHNPHLDHVFTFDRRYWRRPDELFRFLGVIRGYQAEVAFVLSSVSFSVTSAAIALASGARYVVGADSTPFGWDLSRQAFSLEMPSQPELDCHAVMHSLAPLRALGITTDDPSTVVVPASKEIERAEAILKELGLGPGYWALHPGAGKRQNLWPAAGFAEMARRAAAAGAGVLVMHGPADAEPLARLRDGLDQTTAGAIRICPPCPVGVGAALLDRADRFLCNDTGVMHIAGALGVPTLALFGPTDPELWKPPHPAVRVLRSPHQRSDARGREFGWLENLDVDTVWAEWAGLPPRL